MTRRKHRAGIYTVKQEAAVHMRGIGEQLLGRVRAQLGDGSIGTTHVFPPIPTRAFDWCAWWDGEEETGPFGTGETEIAAVRDLLASYPRERDAESGLTPEQIVTFDDLVAWAGA